MIEINNKHIVLIFIIIIIGVFIYNYDVYVISKNQPLCKPIYITKREITPEIRAELNKEETNILKEAFNNISVSGYLEEFGNLNIDMEIKSNFDIPPKSFSSFVIPSITDKNKLKVIDSVIKVLSYIPTNYSENQIKQMVEYFGIIYQNSTDLENFYKNISASTKIKEEPYNTKYSHLILFLIGKFDNDYTNLQNENKKYDENCDMGELIDKLMEEEKLSQTNNKYNTINPNHNLNHNSNPDTLSNYLTSEINNLISNNNLTPDKIMNLINNIKQNYSNNQNQNQNQIINSNPTNNSEYSNIIYPEENIHTQTLTPPINKKKSDYTNYSNYPEYLEMEQPTNTKIKQPKISQQIPSKNTILPQTNKKCNGSKCTLKCDSSYMNAIKYLDNELKPIEGFGNVGYNYASF